MISLHALKCGYEDCASGKPLNTDFDQNPSVQTDYEVGRLCYVEVKKMGVDIKLWDVTPTNYLRSALRTVASELINRREFVNIHLQDSSDKVY